MTPRGAMRIETEMQSVTKIATEREIKTATQIGTGKHTPNAPTVNIPSPIPTAGSAVSLTERSVTEKRATDSNATNVVDSAAVSIS
jgi:hypothetical protein